MGVAPTAATCSEVVRALKGRLLIPGSPIAAELAESYAWQLLEKLTGLPRARLIAAQLVTLDHAEQEWLDEACRLLVHEHMPIQYILGSIQFLDCTITVRPPYLIPRVETEAWVAALIDFCRAHGFVPQSILDLCTGSGCIALALAHAYTSSEVVGVDCVPGTVMLAAENARINGSGHVRFLCGDLFAPVAGHSFDLIVANPPYIPLTDRALLDRSVTAWEDPRALFGGVDGLDLIRTIVLTAPQYAMAGRALHLWIEIDHSQEQIVHHLFRNTGFTAIESWYDGAGYPRAVRGALAVCR